MNQNISDLSDDIGGNATSLSAESGQTFDREILISEIVTEFEKQYFNLERTNYEQVMQDWKKRCDHIGKEIIVETHVSTEKGKFIDVTESGIRIYSNSEKQEKEFVAGAIKSLKVVNGSDG